jgi:HlyD family secretion protein
MTRASIASPKPTLDPSGSDPLSRPKKRPERRRGPFILLAILVIAAALIVGGRFLLTGGDSGAPRDLLFTVARDDLLINVVESGSLESGNSVDIKSQVEGRANILRLVPEGTFVEKGQVLCELDASEMIERETSQAISFEKAQAAFVAAQKSHEILKSNGESDIKQAELDVYFADIDLRKYEEGDFPKALRQAEVDITVAQEELKRAKETAEWSRKLAEKGFITRDTLEADELQVTKREFDLGLANQELDVLRKYTYDKDIKTLRSDFEEAEKQLDRVIKRVESEIVQSDADLRSKEATFELEKERLAKLRDQIDKATIRAPQAGLLVYNNSSNSFGRSNQDPIEEGSSVRERQTIFKLPDVTNMIAKIKIHESSYDRVSGGQKAYVRLDAFPDRVWPARVSFVAPLPDSQAWWMNPDLKVYSADVKLGGDTTMLKPGMSCNVEIEVEQLEDVLFVPIQSIFRKGPTVFCYVQGSGGVEAKPVVTGLHNDKMIHIVEGLDEGDRVYLAPPQGAEEIDVPVVEREEQKTTLDESEFPDVTPEEEGGGMEGADASLTYEEYQALPDTEKRSAFMQLSSEDRRKAMSAFMQNMTPEQRERMQQAMGGGAGGFGGSSGAEGGRPEGEARSEGDRPRGGDLGNRGEGGGERRGSRNRSGGE